MPPDAPTAESIQRYARELADSRAANKTDDLAPWVDKSVIKAVSDALVFNLARSLARELDIRLPISPDNLAASRVLARSLVEQAVDAPQLRMSPGPRVDGHPPDRSGVLRIPPTVCSPIRRAPLARASAPGLSLARLLGDAADPELLNDARELQEEALNVSRDSLGTNDPDTLDTMIELLGTLAYAHDWDASATLVAAALDVARNIPGADDPRIPALERIRHEADLLKTTRRDVQGWDVDSRREILISSIRTRGEWDPATVAARMELARARKWEG
jgi:hypothetical protein